MRLNKTYEYQQKTLIVIVVSIFLFFCIGNCYAGKKYHTNQGMLGIYSVPNEKDEILIIKLIKGGPSDKAGLKNGDIILAVNDEVFTASESRKFWDTIQATKPHTKVKLKIKRDDNVLEKSVILGERPYMLHPWDYIFNLLTSGKKVVLLHEFGDIANNCLGLPYNFDKVTWVEGARANLRDSIFKNAIETEKIYKKFKLYDDRKFEQALEKVRRLSDEYTGELGKLRLAKELGITHIMESSFYRWNTTEAGFFGYQYLYYDQYTLRLIDVETGEMVDVDKGQIKFNAQDKIVEEFHPVYKTE